MQARAQSNPKLSVILFFTIIMSGVPAALFATPGASALYQAAGEDWSTPAALTTWSISGAAAASDCVTTKDGCTLKLAPSSVNAPVSVSKTFSGLEVANEPWYVSTFYRASSANADARYVFKVTTDIGYFGIDFTAGANHDQVVLFTQNSTSLPITALTPGNWYRVVIAVDAVEVTVSAKVYDSAGQQVGNSRDLIGPLTEFSAPEGTAPGSPARGPESSEPVSTSRLETVSFTAGVATTSGLLKNPSINFDSLRFEVATPPIAPVASATGGPLAGEITLNWVAPLDDGGAAITRYVIFAGDTSGALQQVSDVPPTTTKFTETGFEPGMTRYYAVRALNRAGEGALSTEVSARSFTLPSAPRNLVASAGANVGEVKLTWAAPTDLGGKGASILNYKVYRGTGANLVPFVDLPGTTLTFTDSHLTNGTSYRYQVAAVNLLGEGSLPILVSAIPKPDTVTAPTAISITPTTGWANLTRQLTFTYTVTVSECPIALTCEIPHEWIVYQDGTPGKADGNVLAVGTNDHSGHAETKSYTVTTPITPTGADGVHGVKIAVNPRALGSQWAIARSNVQLGLPQPDVICDGAPEYYTYLAGGLGWLNSSATTFAKTYGYRLNGVLGPHVAKFQDGCVMSGDGAYEIGYGGALFASTDVPAGSTLEWIDSTGAPVTFIVGSDSDNSGILGDSALDCIAGPFTSTGTIPASCAPDVNLNYVAIVLPASSGLAPTWGRVRACANAGVGQACLQPHYTQPFAGRMNPPFQPDMDANGLGDAWEQVSIADARGKVSLSDSNADDEFDTPCDNCTDVTPSGDGVTNRVEYQWHTVPLGPVEECSATCSTYLANSRDSDEDGWSDRLEIAYWNDPGNDAWLSDARWARFGVAPYDIDRDLKFASGLGTTVYNPDVDADGIADGEEITSTGTYPELADSDCVPEAVTCTSPGATRTSPRQGQPGAGDSIADGPERAYWARIGASAIESDIDGDGIENNLLDPDADGDGILDGIELSTLHGGTCIIRCTSAALIDSDSDRLLDGASLEMAAPVANRFLSADILHDDLPDGSYLFYGEASLGTDPSVPDLGILGQLLGGTPSAPGAFAAIASPVGGVVQLSWAPPTEHGGLSITEYDVYRGDSPTDLALHANTTATTFQDGGLRGGAQYHYRVVARNDVGPGDSTDVVGVVTLPVLPDAPTLHAREGPHYGQVTLNWEPPVDTGGSNVDKYRIYRAAVGEALTLVGETANLHFIDDNLPPGTPYSYQVKAVTAVGEGAASFALQAMASATLGGWGNSFLEREPNNPRDVPSIMWSDPPGDDKKRIYFDSFLIQRNLGSVNTPISGTPGVMYQAFAFYGNWVDCNDDGYIGNFLTGQLEYSAELLIAESPIGDSRCPPSTSTEDPWSVRGNEPNLDGVVREFFWIAPTTEDQRTTREIADPNALVWADFTDPTTPVYDPEANFIYPMPYGTTKDIGSTIHFADSLTGHTLDYAFAYAGAGDVPQDDPTGTPEGQQAWAATRWLKTVWDAEQDPNAPPAMPYVYNGDEEGCSPQVGDPNRLPALPEAYGEFPYQSFSESVLAAGTTLRECAYNIAGVMFDELAAPVDNREYIPLERTSAYKNAPNLYLRYQSAGEPPEGSGANSNNALDASQPRNAALCGNGACNGWYSNEFLIASPHARFFNQYGFTPGASPFADPEITAYAHLGSEPQDRGFKSPGGTETYGHDQCGAAEEGILNGWHCDPADWHFCLEGYYECLRPGLEYHFRDTDAVRYASFPTLVEYDDNHDGVGDAWAETYGVANTPLNVLDSTLLDNDGANIVTEFRWLTDILNADTDGDVWRDGPEINYWSDYTSEAPAYTPDDARNAVNPIVEDPASTRAARFIATVQNTAGLAAGIATHPAAATSDVDNDGLLNQLDTDSDNDGLSDYDEFEVAGSYPEYPDSDCASTPCSPVKQHGYNSTEREGRPGTGDQWPDLLEYNYWSAHPENMDCDGDGVSNILDADSDDDEIFDGIEIADHSDPCKGDTDDDGLADGAEKAAGTKPDNPDSDGDGMDDLWEVEHVPATTPNSEVVNDDWDFEKDGLTTLQEYYFGSDPRVADTDLDELADLSEFQRTPQTNPQEWDSDSDGMPDGWETRYGLDALDPADADFDPDRDSYRDAEVGAYMPYTNLDEYVYGRDEAGGAWDERTQGPWKQGTHPRNPDTDGDRVSDGDEVAHGTDPRSNLPTIVADRDKDGLTAEQEVRVGSKPAVTDTDDDGLCDGGRHLNCMSPWYPSGGGPGEVIDYTSDPRLNDTDEDGLSDWDEVALFDSNRLGVTPDSDADGYPAIKDPDADGDSLIDGDEARPIDQGGYGTNPALTDTDGDTLTDFDEIFVYSAANAISDPTRANSDNDTLDDGQEVSQGTLIAYWDTDLDGVADGQEVLIGTSPLMGDTDGDGMPDGWEVHYQLDPRVDDSSQDVDNDAVALGLTNLEEFLLDTNPKSSDTDADGINDYLEVLLGLNPKLATDATSDDDGDELSNLHEALLGSLPNVADTDGDGVDDMAEACTEDVLELTAKFTCTDPISPDTDRDGLADGRELAYWEAINPEAWNTSFDGDALGLVPHADNNLRDADSDGDGLDDGQEVIVFRTNASRPDTDGDGEWDFHELLVGWTDPNDATDYGGPHAVDPATDSDGDRLRDADETSVYGTNPNSLDSDQDGLPDGFELILWGVAWSSDIDNDGLVNLLDPDADGDTLVDGVEFIPSALNRQVFYVFDPWSADTDQDTLLDQDEASNGLETAMQVVNPAQAAAVGVVPAPWSGADEIGLYVQGAFGLRLYGEQPAAQPQPDSPSGPGRAGNRGPATDYQNTDSPTDLLRDDEEVRRGCDAANGHSDTDNIPDHLEPHGDADADGEPNCRDTDSDQDTLLDNAEDTNRDGKVGATETSAYDADTDDDARCDGEETASGSLTRPTSPDTDGDGLSDGREYFLRSKCMVPNSFVTTWTDEGRQMSVKMPNGQTLGLGRHTYQAYEGDGTPSANVAGNYPVQDPDWDGDGILDGIEDWNLNGLHDKLEGETSWRLDDSDDDKLMDGLELLINKPMTLAEFIQHHAGSVTQARAAATYDSLNWRKTNPNEKDTDGDKIDDTKDINPNALVPPIIQLDLQALTVHQAVDVFDDAGWWNAYDCSPELYFWITISTAAGQAVLHTPNVDVDPIGCHGQVDLREEFTQVILGDSDPSEDLKSRLNYADGAIIFDLVENIASYSAATTPRGDAITKDQIVVYILAGDTDDISSDFSGQGVEDDYLDISNTPLEVELRVPLSVGSQAVDANGRLAEKPTTLKTDGRDGGSYWNGGTAESDDAGLAAVVKDKVSKDFFDQAVRALSQGKVAPPTGQHWG